MPFINTKTSTPVPAEKRERIKTKLGQAIALIPGKSESWLMVGFEENVPLYFAGDGSLPAAISEIKIFGGASDEAYDALTFAVTEILQEELNIPGNRIYVKYEECDHWGWNGVNF